MKKFIPLILIAAVFTVGSFAHPPHDGKRGEMFAEKLQLTEDQKVSVKAVMETHRERKRALRELDREQKHAAMQSLKQDVRSDLSAILTPEQMTKFDEMQKQRGERRGKHRKKHDEQKELETL